MTSALGYGTSWDDGAHGNVKKILIRYDNLAINMVQFHYLDGDQTLEGAQHGLGSVIGEGLVVPAGITFEKFELEPDEYITEVIAHTAYAVRMIEFATNKRTMKCGVVHYDPDMHSGEQAIMFTGILTGEKIVGFHGISGRFLHQFGAHLAPI